LGKGGLWITKSILHVTFEGLDLVHPLLIGNDTAAEMCIVV